MRLDTAEKRAAYRQAMIPTNAQRDARSGDKAEVWTHTSERTGRPCARGFIGSSGHPTWNYQCRDEARREQYITEFFANQQARQDAKQERKEKRVAFCHTLQVGQLLHTS